MFSAIIVAGGSSRRMGFDKLLAPIAGVPLLIHSIRTFLSIEECAETILVCRPERQDEFRTLIAQHGLRDSLARLRFAPAGPERQDSVLSGLSALAETDGLVAVHDAARPLVSLSLVRKVVEAARRSGGAAAAHPVTDTLKRADSSLNVVDSVDRNNLWAMETPQVFATSALREAAMAASNAGVRLTDEVSAFAFVQRPVTIVHNTEWNPKITFPSDILLADVLYGRIKLPAQGSSPA